MHENRTRWSALFAAEWKSFNVRHTTSLFVNIYSHLHRLSHSNMHNQSKHLALWDVMCVTCLHGKSNVTSDNRWVTPEVQ